MKVWLKKLQSQSVRYANSRWSPWVLLIITLADATFLPTPTTPFFIAISLLNTKKALKYALFATLGTVAGAVAGYLVGHSACINADREFTGIVKFIFNYIPGFSHSGYEKIHLLFAKYNFWVLFTVSLTSIPYGIFSVAAGAFNINIFIFFFSTLISQGIRFLFLALITSGLGLRVQKSIKFRLKINLKPVAVMTEICIVAFTVIANSL